MLFPEYMRICGCLAATKPANLTIAGGYELSVVVNRCRDKTKQARGHTAQPGSGGARKVRGEIILIRDRVIVLSRRTSFVENNVITRPTSSVTKL